MISALIFRKVWLHYYICLFTFGCFAIGESKTFVEIVQKTVNPFKGSNVEFKCPIQTSFEIFWVMRLPNLLRPIIISGSNVTFANKGKYIVNYYERKLTITSIKDNDKGKYVCYRDDINVEYQFIIENVLEPPRFGFVDQNVVVIQGMTTMLVCTAFHMHNFSMSWDFPDSFRRDSLNVRIGHQHKRYNPAGTLTISNTRLSDAGSYICWINRQLNIAIKLTVQENMEDVISPTSVTVNVGSHATLYCFYRPEDISQVKWYSLYYNGTAYQKKYLIGSGQTLLFVDMDGWHNLTIFNVSIENNANYYCHFGESNEKEGKIKLNVLDTTDTSEFGLINPKSLTVFTDETVELKCRPGSYDLLKIYWNSSLGSLSHLKRYYVRYVSETKIPMSILTIPNVSPEDGGLSVNYSCSVMDNEIISVDHVSVTIRERPNFILTNVKKAYVEVGQNQSIPCLVLNLDPMNITWKFRKVNDSGEAQPIPDTDRYIKSYPKFGSASSSVLSIMNVTKMDEMEYVCEVNTSPPMSKGVILIITEPESNQDTSSSIYASTNVTAVVGRPFKLDCIVHASILQTHSIENLSIRWFEINYFLNIKVVNYLNDGKNQLQEYDYETRWNDESKSLDLKIKEIKKVHEGQYYCKVLSLTALNEYNRQLQVQNWYLKTEVLPTMVTQFHEVTVYEDQPLNLTCTVDNIGNEWIQWMKFTNVRTGTYDILSDQSGVLSNYVGHVQNGVSILSTEKSSRENNQGLYQCFIFSHPDIAANISVTVKELPKIEAVDDNIVAMEKDTVELACTYNSQTFTDYQIKWYKIITMTSIFLDAMKGPDSIKFDHSVYYENGKTVLEITNLNKIHEGSYICKLTVFQMNSHILLDISDEINLNVSEIPRVVVNHLRTYKDENERNWLNVGFRLENTVHPHLITYYIVRLINMENGNEITNEYNVRIDRKEVDGTYQVLIPLTFTEYGAYDECFIKVIAVGSRSNLNEDTRYKSFSYDMLPVLNEGLIYYEKLTKYSHY